MAIRVRVNSRTSRNGPVGIHTVGNVPLRWRRLSPCTSSGSVLLIIPIISFAFRGWISRARQPACSISSTIQYHVPVASTATSAPDSHPRRYLRIAPRSCSMRT